MWQEDQHEANLRSSDLLVRVLCLAGSKRDDQFADIVVLNDKLRLALGVGFLDVTQRGSAPYEVALLICTMNVQCKPCIEMRTGVLQSGCLSNPCERAQRVEPTGAINAKLVLHHGDRSHGRADRISALGVCGTLLSTGAVNPAARV